MSQTEETRKKIIAKDSINEQKSESEMKNNKNNNKISRNKFQCLLMSMYYKCF